MKILFVQDHLKSGGAARAAGRWARLLAKAGREVRQVAGDEQPTSGSMLTGKPPRGPTRILEYLVGRAQTRKQKVKQDLEKILQEEGPDLIWFHNLSGGGKWGWSEAMITIARGQAPVLWTLHDMWALGDSSESYWQEDQMVEGGRGKGAGAGGLNDLGVEGLRRSRVEKVCREPGKYPVRLTAPSQWLAGLTKKTTGEECAFLPNPIDLEIYSPEDQKLARRRLDLPEDGLVVLAGADSLKDHRKGFDLLREAWNCLPERQPTLALFGRHGKHRPGEQYLGNLTSDEKMVAAYRAADLYIHPARMENASCSVQESLACGTPVLAFAVGGMPEMVKSGETGILVSSLEAKSLGQELVRALADPRELNRMRMQCRKKAQEIWQPDRLLKKLQGEMEGLKG